MKRLGKLIVFCYVLACLGMAAAYCYGQCPPSGCPQPFGPQPYYQPAPQLPPQTYRPSDAILNSVVRIHNGNTAGSGTIVAVESGHALVISCNHMLEDEYKRPELGQLGIQFRNGPRTAAVLVETEAANDLSAFDVVMPSALSPVPVASADPQPGEMVTTVGWGPGQIAYFNGVFQSHQVIMPGFVRTLEIAGSVRPGDSGGPALNSQWQLCGTIIGTNDLRRSTLINTSCTQPIRDFIERVKAKWRARFGTPIVGVPPKPSPSEPVKPAPGNVPESGFGNIAEKAGSIGLAWGLSALGIGGIPAALAYWLGRRGLHKAIAAIEAKHAAKVEPVAQTASPPPIPQTIVVPPVCRYQQVEQPTVSHPVVAVESNPTVIEKRIYDPGTPQPVVVDERLRNVYQYIPDSTREAAFKRACGIYVSKFPGAATTIEAVERLAEQILKGEPQQAA